MDAASYGKTAARDTPVDLVLLGDSIAHGWMGEGKAVWERYFANISTLNLGFSGDRTENVLWRLVNGEVDGLEPKLVVVMIGTNNTGHRMDSPEVIAADVRDGAVRRIAAKRSTGNHHHEFIGFTGSGAGAWRLCSVAKTVAKTRRPNL